MKQYCDVFRMALLLAIVMSCFIVGPAVAQNRAFQLQQFRPWGDPEGIFQTQSGQTLGQVNYMVGVYFNYAYQPLVGRSKIGQTQSIVDHQLGMDIVGGFGILPWLDVLWSVPVTLYQIGRIPDHLSFAPADRGQDLTGFALGDPKIAAKAQFLKEKDHFIDMSALFYLGLPVGDHTKMNGEDTFSFGLTIAASKTLDPLHISVNLGYRFLPSTNFGGLVVQHEITYAFGARFILLPKQLELVAEHDGAIAISEETGYNTASLNLYAGIRYYPMDNQYLALNVGLGTGFIAGYGTPPLRVLFGLTWSRRVYDKDQDGVMDDVDKCPKVAGPPENHGCPWKDTDGDGLLDNVDKCPNFKGPKENQGCPWPDTDGDGVTDKYDKCPNFKGPIENRGCPWPDTDGDGLTDNIDKCPTVKGPRENFGCPWKDTDGDGVYDNFDKCPTVKGPKQNQGCPWPDTDGDGVTDNIDKCPTIKGPKENNGCPWADTDGDGLTDNVDKCPTVKGPIVSFGCPIGDRDKDGVFDHLDQCPDIPGVKVATPKTKLGCPAKMLIEIKKDEIKILQKIQFSTGSANILRVSFPVLNQIAAVLNSRPKIRIQIEGHTDNVGNKLSNQRLSENRARAVFLFLTKRGKIDEKRLGHRGYGMDKPMVPNKTRANRAINRRVQFKVIPDGQPLFLTPAATTKRRWRRRSKPKARPKARPRPAARPKARPASR